MVALFMYSTAPGRAPLWSLRAVFKYHCLAPHATVPVGPDRSRYKYLFRPWLHAHVLVSAILLLMSLHFYVIAFPAATYPMFNVLLTLYPLPC